MTWRLISTETTRAERNLTRATATVEVDETFFGPIDHTPKPSIGGIAEVTHDYWRCDQCHAGLVTKHSDQPTLPACDHPVIKRNNRR